MSRYLGSALSKMRRSSRSVLASHDKPTAEFRRTSGDPGELEPPGTAIATTDCGPASPVSTGSTPATAGPVECISTDAAGNARGCLARP
jgi:hypothetical protein